MATQNQQQQPQDGIPAAAVPPQQTPQLQQTPIVPPQEEVQKVAEQEFQVPQFNIPATMYSGFEAGVISSVSEVADELELATTQINSLNGLSQEQYAKMDPETQKHYKETLETLKKSSEAIAKANALTRALHQQDEKLSTEHKESFAPTKDNLHSFIDGIQASYLKKGVHLDTASLKATIQQSCENHSQKSYAIATSAIMCDFMALQKKVNDQDKELGELKTTNSKLLASNMQSAPSSLGKRNRQAPPSAQVAASVRPDKQARPIAASTSESLLAVPASSSSSTAMTQEQLDALSRFNCSSRLNGEMHFAKQIAGLL
jgi:hypothetical protein